MSTVIDTLITDRTAADVARVHELAVKGYAGMTAAELAEWLAGMKGAYNAVDLNRVGTALNYLRDRLTGVCGRDITWKAGMSLIPNAYYTHNGETKVWMGEAGARAEWTDAAFVPI